MKKYLKISLVIPYYNEGKELIRTINSILNEKYLPKEIILVDSTSTDNTFFEVNKFLRTIRLRSIKIKNISKCSIFPQHQKI